MRETVRAGRQPGQPEVREGRGHAAGHPGSADQQTAGYKHRRPGGER